MLGKVQDLSRGAFMSEAASYSGIAMKEIPSVIADQALVVFEIGWTQGNAVKDMFHRFFPDADVRVKKDLNGKDRIVCAVIEQHS